MSDDKVVSLDGKPVVVESNTPDQNCIEAIEHLLDLAKQGQVRAVAYVIRHPDDCTSGTHAGYISVSMAGELLYSANHIMNLIRS